MTRIERRPGMELAIVLLTICVGMLALPRAADAAETREEMRGHLKVSALCLVDDETARNQDHVVEMIREAGERGGNDLIVVPLTPFLSFQTGGTAREQGGRGAEESRPSPPQGGLRPFIALAREYETYLAVALTEELTDGGKAYTSVLIDRAGGIVGTYRKSHAFPDEDDLVLGDDLQVFETDFGTIGLTIGTDIYFPEVYWVQAMKGADILVWQHAPERFREHSQWPPLLKARALDSHVHLVTAMYADPRTYITNRYQMGMQGAALGRSMVLNRVGIPLADTGHEDGVATAILDLDKRKQDPYEPFYEEENTFFVNNLGDRKAFGPLAQPWDAPDLPPYQVRKARVAVGYFRGQDMWRDDVEPEAMLRILDEAGKVKPDLVLLSEMSTKVDNETTQRVMADISERARRMKAYVLIGGIGDSTENSICKVWDREGNLVFGEPRYWDKGFPEIEVYDTDFARIGIQTCGDVYLGEVARTLGVKGAEIIFDPSQMWGGDGQQNELLLRARAIDNGSWLACAHWNSSDPGLRTVIVDPYGQVVAASQFQKEGVIHVDVDFDDGKVYYAGRKENQPRRGTEGIGSYYTEDIPEQRSGWREMMLGRRRPELYRVLTTENEATRRYRPSGGAPWY